ncbi:AtpZ/AtpI family protein [Candidatus Roizmanbacteria bacterium]|nr:AtpZ/AtpI family protein [Candidatus Roizmanbacteria bacterium]
MVGKKLIDDDFIQRAFPKNKSRKRGSGALDLTYLNIGFYLITPILLGVLLGYNMDVWFKSKPFFLILFLVLGTLSSFYNLWKLTKEQK